MNIDATNHVLGRLATVIVQRLKDGENVNVFNAEKAIVKGRPKDIADTYRDKYNKGNRDHGPHFPKAPERILKRTVRGMIPDTKQGTRMEENLRTYTGDADKEMITINDAYEETLSGRNYLTLKQISKRIGG